MRRTKLAAAAVALAVGVAMTTTGPAGATDNIKTFGEQERLNGPNRLPYIGYTVFNLTPSSDPVPHNGNLYVADLAVDGFGGNPDPMIARFGARAQNGDFYPSIWGASNPSRLYFDVVGAEPNSVVWNDGIRDILAWIPGELPLEPRSVMPGPTEPPPAPEPAPAPEPLPAPGEESAGAEAGTPGMPAESDPAIVATPNELAPPPFELTEAEVAEPGFGR